MGLRRTGLTEIGEGIIVSTLRCRAPVTAACLLTAAAILMTAEATAETLRIGLAAPLSGPFAILGEQMRTGALAASGTFANAEVELTVADDGCSAEGGEAAARFFVEDGVRLATGFLCTEAVEAALPLLTEAGIATLMTGVRTNRLTDNRERTGWIVFRWAPRADAEARAVADILTRRWRTELFAVVDDGTLYGRELTETLRFAAEAQKMEPIFVDTFRPQLDNQLALVGRLARAGATHVFVGGDRDDIAIIARDAARLGHALTVAGGEALRADGRVPLPQGVLMIGLPDWADIADPAMVARLRRTGIMPDGYVLPSFATLEIAAAALLAAGRSGLPLKDILSQQTFATALGPVKFDEKGDRVGSFYRLFRYDGMTFQPVE
jgi:branched-chain amino acid transport system substrate-binding protein